jgi:hypothetical protein
MRIILLFIWALAGCGFAAEAPTVPQVLQKAGRAIEGFWVDFSSINCRETVSQQKLNAAGKIVSGVESAFDYIVMMREEDGDLAVEESRKSLGSRSNGKPGALLVTNGFPTLLFVFHPRFQDSFEYATPVAEERDGRQVVRVGFRQAKGGRALSCLRMRRRDYPLEWAGTAWIDWESGHILRIAAELASGMQDIGLESLTADVQYGPVRFHNTAEEPWLPAAATVEARTRQQRWRNVHHFTTYKRFTVETDSRQEMPKQ